MIHTDKIIFNSIGQLERFADRTAGLERGLRLNPQASSSGFDLADPARPYSLLGEWNGDKVAAMIGQLDGFMIHNNCENADFALFARMLAQIEERFGALLERGAWVRLGGGIHFSGDDYALDAFGVQLRAFFAALRPTGLSGARRGGRGAERDAQGDRARHLQ